MSLAERFSHRDSQTVAVSGWVGSHLKASFPESKSDWLENLELVGFLSMGALHLASLSLSFLTVWWSQSN